MVGVSTEGGLAKSIESQLPPNDARTQMLTQMLNDPSNLAALILFSLIVMFVILTALPIIGGALGAKVLDQGMIRAAVLIAAIALAADPLFAALTPQQRQLNIDSFEYVWKTIRDKHWQTRPGGLDWQAIHDEFRPKIEKADSMDACARPAKRDARAAASDPLRHRSERAVFELGKPARRV